MGLESITNGLIGCLRPEKLDTIRIIQPAYRGGGGFPKPVFISKVHGKSGLVIDNGKEIIQRFEGETPKEAEDKLNEYLRKIFDP